MIDLLDLFESRIEGEIKLSAHYYTDQKFA